MTVLQKFKQPVEVWGFQVRLGGNLGVVNHANTADRIYTFPDVAGNVLLDNSFLGHALPALSAGYLNWTGTTWALSAVSAFTNPMIAADDMIIGGASGAPNRLPIGTAGQVLTIVGGVPTWSNTGLAPTAFTVASAIPVLTFTRSDLTASVTFTQTTATNVTLSCDFTANKFNGSGAGLTLGTVTDSYTIQSLGTVTTAQTISIANGRCIKMTLGASTINITLPNGTNANTTEKLIFELTQDGTGSRTVLWLGKRGFPSNISPILTTTPGALDIIEFTWDGSFWTMTNFTPNIINTTTALQGLRPSTYALSGGTGNKLSSGSWPFNPANAYDTGTSAVLDTTTYSPFYALSASGAGDLYITYSGFYGSAKSGTLYVNLIPYYSALPLGNGTITVSYSSNSGSTWTTLGSFTQAQSNIMETLSVFLYNQTPSAIQVKIDLSYVNLNYCGCLVYDVVFI